jgi:hypothetical protein
MCGSAVWRNFHLKNNNRFLSLEKKIKNIAFFDPNKNRNRFGIVATRRV